MRVAFLGLGAIGAPIASHFAGPHRLTVWNRTRGRADAFARGREVRIAESPREAAEGADVLCTCLPTSAEVEAVLFGPNGAAGALAKGSLVIDCTSGDPGTSRRIAERLAAQGVDFVDAPVSGGVSLAEKGELTVMLGGSAEAAERARPLVALFGKKKVVHIGPVGAGHAVKGVNNALLAANILSAAEGITALVKAGVAPRLAVETINASSGASFVTQSLVPDRVLTGAYPKSFRLALLDKDCGIALDLVNAMGIDSAVLTAVKAKMAALRAVVGEEDDYMAPFRVAESLAKVAIRG
ncbi:MAG TPA: NAD(P)-dependent oxidoreductase [Gemmatimonadales bacterium]|nr:NAD(P)-dependent oxidoreductase [Gemmatimonadales bacterium]